MKHFALVCVVALHFCPPSEARMAAGRFEQADGFGTRTSAVFGPALPGPGDTLWSFTCPGPFCNGLAWDGEHFWLSRGDSAVLYRLSSTGVVETVFGLPPEVVFPADLTWDGAHLWMVDEQSARAYELDPATGNALRSFRLPDSASADPNSWGLAWDGQYLWHSDYTGTGHIYQLDTVAGAVVSQFIPPNGDMLGIAWDGTYLWGVDMGTQFAYKMTVPAGTVVDSFEWQVPSPLGLVWDGSFFWNVSSSTDRVYKVGGATGVLDGGAATPARRGFLSRPEPNPFVHLTRLACDAPAGCLARAGVFDTGGRLVRTLEVNRESDLVWDGRDNAGRRLPAGTYFVCCDAGGERATAHLVLQR